MTGIRELFAEYENAELDWFQLQFCFEQTYQRQLERNRATAKLSDMRRNKTAERKAYKNKWVCAYQANKLRTDPEWAEKRRKATRERMRRSRAEKRAAKALRAA